MNKLVVDLLQQKGLWLLHVPFLTKEPRRHAQTHTHTHTLLHLQPKLQCREVLPLPWIQFRSLIVIMLMTLLSLQTQLNVYSSSQCSSPRAAPAYFKLILGWPEGPAQIGFGQTGTRRGAAPASFGQTALF